jgi:hypothetical protein
MYDTLNHGRIDVGSLRRRLTGLTLPRAGQRHTARLHRYGDTSSGKDLLRQRRQV